MRVVRIAPARQLDLFAGQDGSPGRWDGLPEQVQARVLALLAAVIARSVLAAWSRPATANRRTTFIAAAASQTARLSSRCIRSGARSPARSASVQPLRRGRSLISAAAYLPACSHGSTRVKHGRSSSSSSARFRRPRPTLILAAAAAFDSVVFTNA